MLWGGVRLESRDCFLLLLVVVVLLPPVVVVLGVLGVAVPLLLLLLLLSWFDKAATQDWETTPGTPLEEKCAVEAGGITPSRGTPSALRKETEERLRQTNALGKLRQNTNMYVCTQAVKI